MAEADDCDVLIVGGGPVGALLAVLLGQQGVRVVMCEASHDVYPLPRAVHLDHEAMRILQAAGIAEEISPLTRPVLLYDFVTARGELLLRFDVPEGPAPGGWPASNMIHQPGVEHALRRRIAALETAQLFTGWTCHALDVSAQSVSAHFSTEAGTQQVNARFVVGCDGASSFVRKAAGIGFHDFDFDEPWLVIDALVSDISRLPDRNLQLCDPERPTTSVLLPGGRHRWEFMLKPGETAEAALDDAFIHNLLASWNLGRSITIERKAVYRFHALVAQEWRRGRILLAGDAAHQMPPFAGQGLCSGLRDAINLAWKLGHVLRDEASEALLDTYQSEREPDVRAIIESALMMGRTVCVLDKDVAAARDAAMLAARARGEMPPPPGARPPVAAGFIDRIGAPVGALFPQFLSADGASRLDDALGASAWLISGAAPATATQADHVSYFSLNDPKLAPFRAGIDAWLNRHESEAVLVRPDRIIFAAGDPQHLSDAYQTRLTARSLTSQALSA